MRRTGGILLASTVCLCAIGVQMAIVVAVVGGGPGDGDSRLPGLAGSPGDATRSADDSSAARGVRMPLTCRGDANCDGQIDFADINSFVDAVLYGVFCDGTGHNADMSRNGAVGFDDVNLFVDLMMTPLPIGCGGSELSVDHPAQLALGDLITLNLTPAGGGLSFDPDTTVRYEDATLAFAIDWAPEDIHIVSGSEAVLIVGTGTTDADVSLFLNPPSALHGTLRADFGGVTLEAGVDLTLAPPQGSIRKIAYTETGMPSLGEEPDALAVAWDNGGQVPSEAELLYATYHHHAVAVPIVNNAYTQQLTTLVVQFVTYNASGGSVVDSFPVTLTPIDTGASPILFVSDVTVALVPLNVPVNRPALGYTQVFPFQTSDNGFAAVLPVEVEP